MDISPSARAIRFHSVEAGELFVYFEKGEVGYGIKTAPVGGDSCFVTLGPTFDGPVRESTLAIERSMTVVSFGTNFSIVLPTDPAAWSEQVGSDRSSVWLAVAGDHVLICTNLSQYAGSYRAGFLNAQSGELLTGLGSGAVAFTNNWEIVVSQSNHSTRTLLKYPRGS